MGPVDNVPDSPPYMRLAGQKKMRKVRKTIYEDPGNPFTNADDHVEGEVSIFNMPFQPSISDGLYAVHSGSAKRSPSDSIHSNHPATGPITTNESTLLSGRPFEDAVESPSVPASPRPPVTFPNTIHAPTPLRRVTPPVIREHRQSSSTAVVMVASPDVVANGDKYVAPRAVWRRKGLPRHRPRNPPRDEEVRNTKFYGFYDDILLDYEKRVSRL